MTETGRHRRRDAETENRPTTDEPTMREVSHTNPLTGQSFQDAYLRGPAMADGPGGHEADSPPGEPTPRDDGEGEGEGEETAEDETMDDVDHTSPTEADANTVWERGGEADGEDEPTTAAETDSGADNPVTEE